MESLTELAIREMIMAELARRMESSTILTRDELESFTVAGQVHKLVDQSRGIRNPNYLDATITIISNPKGPYDDGMGNDSLFRYDYQRGSDEGSNTKLRRAMELELPIIMLRTVATGQWVPIFPVYVRKDDRPNRQFLLALDEGLRFIDDPMHLTPDQRRYADRVIRQRLHQPEFRAKVLLAYRRQCAVCVLKKEPLLDAAHITADADEKGLPLVTNGLSLCKIHHAAYDANFLGITPDYVVRINEDLLLEIDGPMLKHGIQEMNGRKLAVPAATKLRPDKDRLALRFEAFLDAG